MPASVNPNSKPATSLPHMALNCKLCIEKTMELVAFPNLHTPPMSQRAPMIPLPPSSCLISVMGGPMLVLVGVVETR